MSPQEYNESVELYADRLFLFAYKRIQNHEQAKDIVQESFTKIWLKRNEIQSSKIKSYLFTTCHRAIIDYVRHRDKFSAETTIPESRSRESNHDLKEIMDQALNRLPDIQQTVLMLRDYEGYNYQEIAEVTSLSESQVKVYIFRARKKMKDYLVKLDLVL